MTIVSRLFVLGIDYVLSEESLYERAGRPPVGPCSDPTVQANSLHVKIWREIVYLLSISTSRSTKNLFKPSVF